MRPAARTVTIGDTAETWAALGLPTSLGGIELELAGGGGGILGVTVEGLTNDHPDGLPLTAARTEGTVHRPACGGRPVRTEGTVPSVRKKGTVPSVRKKGTVPSVRKKGTGLAVIDHLVAFTDSLARSVAAMEAAGLDLRRRRDPPEAPMPQAFFNLSTTILEVGETERADGCAFWGLTIAVPDLDALVQRLGPERVGTPRDAVQPGRRIATLRREAGLSFPLALMTPRVRTR